MAREAVRLKVSAMAITGTVPEPRPPSSFGASSNRCVDVRLGNRSQLRCDRDCLILARLARFTCLLDFRDSYGLLDHLNSDGFDCWSDRLFHFRRSFLLWCAFGLGSSGRSQRSLGYLACLTPNCRC